MFNTEKQIHIQDAEKYLRRHKRKTRKTSPQKTDSTKATLDTPNVSLNLDNKMKHCDKIFEAKTTLTESEITHTKNTVNQMQTTTMMLLQFLNLDNLPNLKNAVQNSKNELGKILTHESYTKFNEVINNSLKNVLNQEDLKIITLIRDLENLRREYKSNIILNQLFNVFNENKTNFDDVYFSQKINNLKQLSKMIDYQVKNNEYAKYPPECQKAAEDLNKEIKKIFIILTSQNLLNEKKRKIKKTKCCSLF